MQTDNSGKDKEENGKEQARDATLSGQAELPQEVRTKLRKLERLESKYSGMCLFWVFCEWYVLTRMQSS